MKTIPLLLYPAQAYKRVMKLALRAQAVTLAFALASASLLGQATSQIQGIITDPTGHVVAEAQVKATETQTGAVRLITTSREGVYVLSNLPIGPYKLEVSKSGFKTYARPSIVLGVATSATVDITLEVGAVSETVTVEAQAPLVETQNTSVGAFFENTRIEELPLNGRNAMELLQYGPAAVPGGKNTTSGYPGGLNLAIAGGQLAGIGYSLDGTMYNNLLDAVNLPFPIPDALQEFKIETSTMTAKNGTHASAAVSASIKSGTNQFHGDLFEFLRNGNMNARNSFAGRRDTLKRNQFGGTIGGPILRNKLFFFAGYQGTRTRSDPDDRTAHVPSAQMLTGNFSGCPDFKNIDIKDPNNSGIPFPGKLIPVESFSKQALKVVDFLPKSSDPCGKVSFGPITKSSDHQVLGRVDYIINSKQQFFARYLATSFAQPPPYALSHNVLDSVSPGLDDLAQSAAIGHTYIASPNLVNQFRFAFNRVAIARSNDDYFSGCSIGVEMYCYVPKQTILSVGPAGTGSSFTIGAAPATPGTFVPTYLTLADDVTAVRGAHTFAFGYASFKYQHSQRASATVVGNFAFPGNATGLGMTDFLLGRLGTLTQSAPNGVYTNKWGHGLYAQDTWKVSRRLTLNYGLRWEPFLPQALNDGAVYNFSLDAFKAGARSQVYQNAPPGLSYPGDPGFQGKTGVNKRWNQFAPRVGIAYDPRGNGMTSIRASGGIAYDFPNLQIMSNPTSAPPFANRVITQGPVAFDKPYGAKPSPFPVVPGTFPEFGTFVAQQPDAKGPTTYTWNFSLQHQIGKDWLLSASYLGSQSIHLWVGQALNPAVIVPGPFPATCASSPFPVCNAPNNINQRRLASLANSAADAGGRLGSVDIAESGGSSNYHGLILTTQKRIGRGVSLNANYTWSHCIGDMPIGSMPGSPSLGGGTFIDPNDRRRDRGNCSTVTVDGSQATDRRHVFNFTAVLEAPRFQDSILNRIASNWRLSSSYRFLSASYLTVTNGTDRALTGAATADQRANQSLADVFCKRRNSGCWINSDAYGPAALGTLGNSGRANVAGPGFFGIDMAVSRIFRLPDSMSLEARGEAFNLTNGVRLNAPITARNSADFGRVLTAQDPRIMQVALKLVF